jgi:hypothetical protein
MNRIDAQGFPDIAYIRTRKITTALPGEGFQMTVSYTAETDESRPFVSVDKVLDSMRSDEVIAAVAQICDDFVSHDGLQGDESTELAKEILAYLTTPRLIPSDDTD